jgi:hypothetical protein
MTWAFAPFTIAEAMHPKEDRKQGNCFGSVANEINHGDQKVA